MSNFTDNTLLPVRPQRNSTLLHEPKHAWLFKDTSVTLVKFMLDTAQKNWIHGTKSLLTIWQSLTWPKNLQPFTETVRSTRCWQQPVTGPCPEIGKSSLHPQTLFLTSILILPYHSITPSSLFTLSFLDKINYTFFTSRMRITCPANISLTDRRNDICWRAQAMKLKSCRYRFSIKLL